MLMKGFKKGALGELIAMRGGGGIKERVNILQTELRLRGFVN